MRSEGNTAQKTCFVKLVGELERAVAGVIIEAHLNLLCGRREDDVILILSTISNSV